MTAAQAPLPAMPASPVMAKLQAELHRSQWWPSGRLVDYQMHRLAALLRHAWETVPFYRPRLEAAGWRPGLAIDPVAWSQLPVLTRREVQAHGLALRSMAVPAGDGPLSENRSSGSTGMPVAVQVTGRTSFLWKALALRNQLWQRRDFALTFGAIRRQKAGVADYPAGQVRDRWGSTTMLPFPTGPSVLLSIATPLDGQAEWLRRQSLGYLLTYPSNLAGLAALGRDGALPLPGLRQLATVGEVTTPELRRLCREAWGVGISDDYSAEEVGYIALQCPDHEHLHVQGETVLVEILDDHGKACAPGEIGRVVVTPLHNYAMPLLRYEIGDLAQAGAPCPCGRGLPVLARVMGRVRNTLVTPDGRRYWPFFGTHSFATIAPIRQHRFVQRTRERIEARLVMDQPLTDDQAAALRAHLRARLPWPFEIDIVYVAELPRSAGGKFEDFQSDVA